MTTNMHGVLRSLCLNTDWKYAIFWKLKHRARTILTWEDAYYDTGDYDSSNNECCQKTLKQFRGGHYPHDPLVLAVEKMSYHSFSLGEGIIGQVAVTGKHQWICADNHATGSDSSIELADGLQSQFSAGIRTIVVVAVVPLGVVQLGSLNKMIEDMRVVTHIRNIFLAAQDFLISHDPSQMQSGPKNSSSLPDVSMTKLSSETVPACLHDTEETTKSEKLDILMPFPSSGKNIPTSAVFQKMAVDVTKYGGPEFCSSANSVLLQSVPNIRNVENTKFVDLRPLNERKSEGDSSGCKDMMVESEKNVTSLLHSSVMENNSSGDLICPPEKAEADFACFPSDLFDVVCQSDKLYYLNINQKEELTVPRPSDASFQKDAEKSEFQSEPSYRSASDTLLKFPAGCELHEALGPAFLKSSRYVDSEAQVNQDVKTMEMPDEISCSQLTGVSRAEHLLEAIVANVRHSNNDTKSELSYSTSMHSVMMSERNPEVSVHTVHTINSEGYSLDQSSLVREDTYHSLTSSGICGAPKGISSTCPSSCSEQFEKSSEPGKNKKRARPGESSRPRPRDRQLIQDRIKELRELVPHGAKCSIDSLLERTIKHLLFLQSITKHADKLNNFADSKTKLHHMESAVPGSSSYEQGSSWAVEVGGHLKVHSILVESISKNGQMLVEMLCEECSHFLEIAEAVRSLGLTILKGATEAHGEKTWICFVVEGQNNRNVHRLDILWPLVQILQSKSTMHSQ